MPPPLLYLHPAGHLNDFVVPAGALASLNAVRAPKLGRFAFEVADEELAAARVVAVDLHWAVGVPGFSRLVGHVRRVNPRATIVAGGITAGIHARALVDDLGVDFVVRGDAERDFAALCGALLDGRDPGVLPNVVGRHRPGGVPRRMTQEEFDATDCVTAGWFPTYERVSDWSTAVYSMARTIPVLRGCPMRCSACYGSYAQVMGEGHLVRSPASLAREVARAAESGLRSLRLIFAKPPPAVLSALLRGLAAAGPFPFPSPVGVYLCTPPTEDDLGALEAAFAAEVELSLIPPDEHEPALSPERLGDEEQRWRAASLRVDRSSSLRLAAWPTRGADTRRAREVFPAGERGRVDVLVGTSWRMTRPRADGRPTLAELDRIMAPLWTFYGARLLSPALARLLAPFRFLDDVEGDPETLPRPQDPLGRFHDVALEGWRAHRLPFLPGLEFSVLPLHRDPGGTPPARRDAGVLFHGSAGAIAAALAATPVGPEVPLSARLDHSALRLRSGPIATALDRVAFVPHLAAAAADGGPATLQPAAFGAVVLEAPRRLAGLEVRVALRIQEAELALVDASGAPVSRARLDLGFFTPVPPRPASGARERSGG